VVNNADSSIVRQSFCDKNMQIASVVSLFNFFSDLNKKIGNILCSARSVNEYNEFL